MRRMDDKSEPKKSGGDLFIVDNSDKDWKVREYLHEWADLSHSFDIATGYFEIGARCWLDGQWQKLEKLRILMGDEVSMRTKKALLAGIDKAKSLMDSSLEKEKEGNDFLTGVPAIVDALHRRQIECKVYSKEKFHAKAYITHAKKAVVGSVALVGSSNFTPPGLLQNIELNIQIRREVELLQEWYDRHWNEADDITDELLKVIERHTRDYPPFEVYAKALQELFEHRTLSDEEWDRTESKLYPVLDEYQREGYHSLVKIARQHNGALLCDGVGLGKTFIGLMLIERLVMRDHKRVVLLVPKSGRKAVWENTINRRAPHLLNGFLPFKIYNHTDLMRGLSSVEGRDFPAELEQIKQQADVVVIDEAHNFRNRGLATTAEDGIRSRYWKLYDIIGTKTVFMLTATPVNNALVDLQHLIELFSRVENPAAFASTVGIHHLPAHFQQLEKNLKRIARNLDMGELFDVDPSEASKILLDDKLFRALVVQRSRAYAKQSQLQHGGTEADFPVKSAPQVAKYSILKTYGHLLTEVEKAFSRPEQLFSLAVYYPLSKWKGDPAALDVFDENRQKQVVRLIRIQFLKRFESSIYSFENSCQNLLLKLRAFLVKNSTLPAETKRLHRWDAQNEELLTHLNQRRIELSEEYDSDGDEADDDGLAGLGAEFLEDFAVLDRDKYRIEEIFDETYDDLNQLVKFLEELKPLDASHDDKLQSLIKLLKGDKVLSKHKVLIFTEFMCTARYLRRELQKAGIHGVEEIDSGSKRERGDAIQCFAPFYNGSSSADLVKRGKKEIRVLISTDVLSEGLNLQDATRLINYDLHWNPVRLMQRIGRVDRRLDSAIEAKILAEHPDQKDIRRTVAYWNFLPPKELDKLIKLYETVSRKTLRISKVFGIEGKKLLTPRDNFDALKDFLHELEGAITPVEKMHLEYQQLLATHPGLDERLRRLPGRVFSGKSHPRPGTKALFLCYNLPAEDKSIKPSDPQLEAARWTEDAGKTGWYVYDIATEKILERNEEIAEYIRCAPETPRQVAITNADLRKIRLNVEKYIKNTYLKLVQAPQGVKPVLKCWMELN